MDKDIASLRVALVGYGEAGRIFGAALSRAGVARVTAFDVLIANETWAGEARTRASGEGVTVANDIGAAVNDAGLVICAVTAAKARSAAEQIAAACRRDAFVLDVNSASPRTKRESAQAVEAAGGRYVEAAILNAVPPQGIRVPMLLGGPHAPALMPMLQALGFNPEIGSDQLGVVSAIKLCRSVVMKGIEALIVESLLSARRYGVEDQVLASLKASYPGLDWDKLPTYCWSRVVQHGARRAEEMREAAGTVRDAGLEPHMAASTAEVQAWIAALRQEGVFDGAAKDADWRELADRVGRRRS